MCLCVDHGQVYQEDKVVMSVCVCLPPTSSLHLFSLAVWPDLHQAVPTSWVISARLHGVEARGWSRFASAPSLEAMDE